MTNLRNLVDTTLIPHTAFQDALKRVGQCFAHADGAVEPICLAIVGESRTGKSRAQEEFSVRYPITRLHDGLRVPVLRVRAPSKPTVKGFAELMLRTLGDPKYAAGSEQSKTGRLIVLMRSCGTRMVMIDEFQHFYDKVSHKVMHEVADWLKNLVDDTRIALVVAGLPTCSAVLDQNEQLAGRFLAPVFMPRFDWANNTHRAEYLGILGAFHQSLAAHFDLPVLDSDDMGFRCFCATGGLMGYLTKFLRQATCNAIDSGTKVISLEDLSLAHDQAVWAKEGLSDVVHPFDRRFSAQPTETLLARIRLIGTAADATKVSRARVPHSMKAPNVSEVLTGH